MWLIVKSDCECGLLFESVVRIRGDLFAVEDGEHTVGAAFDVGGCLALVRTTDVSFITNLIERVCSKNKTLEVGHVVFEEGRTV